MAVASLRGFGGGQSNVMMMRNESISDSLVAMLGSCASPHIGLQGIGQKRPFFPSYNDGPTVDEGEDGEDGGDDCSQQVEKKRRLTFDQVRSLEKNFEIENKLEPERKMQLAKELGLQPRQVAVWFQNRRARWKIKQLERDYEALTVDYNRLKANLEVALRDKDNLKAEVKRLKGNNNSNSLSVAVKGCAGADPSTQCRSEALSPSSVLQVDHDSYSDSPSSENNVIHNPSKNFHNNSSAGPLKEESRRTTSSDSNLSSDVVEGDSPRTSDSCSLSTRMQSHLDQQEQWTHCSPQFPSDNSFNVGVDELSQQLAFQRGAAVKLEDGIGFNADQPFLISRLDVDQGTLPWWDWP